MPDPLLRRARNGGSRSINRERQISKKDGKEGTTMNANTETGTSRKMTIAQSIQADREPQRVKEMRELFARETAKG